jgi:hypothetical protein
MERRATSTVSVKTRNHVISTGIVFDIICLSVVDLLELFVVTCHLVFPAGQSIDKAEIGRNLRRIRQTHIDGTSIQAQYLPRGIMRLGKRESQI